MDRAGIHNTSSLFVVVLLNFLCLLFIKTCYVRLCAIFQQLCFMYLIKILYFQ